MPERLLMIDLSGPRLTADERAFLSEHPVGGVCLFARNIEDRFQVAELTAELRSLCGDAFLVATDQEGGGVVRPLDVPYPPSAMALGAADDPALSEKVGAATARGLRSQGINLNFAPVADVNSNPRNPVIADRSFGEDPARVARHVAAFVRGTQAEGVAACVKHFPGHGDTETDSHLGLPVLEADLKRLEGLEFIPFRAALTANVAAVMSAHIVLPGFDAHRPATLSQAVLTGLLREHLGFDGVIFTDALNMRAVADRYSPTGAVLGALAAGADMPVHVGPLPEHREVALGLRRALAEGRLEPASVERSLARVTALARRYPAQTDPGSAWAEGDADLLQLAAARALVQFGELNLTPPLTLVAAAQVQASAASQTTVSPAEALGDALEQAGLAAELLRYSRESGVVLEEARLLERVTRAPGTVVFVSTARTRMDAEERAFAQAVARAAPSFVHLALWNPYHVNDLPAPALVTFGFREMSLRAAAAALAGAPVSGTPPVTLEPLSR